MILRLMNLKKFVVINEKEEDKKIEKDLWVCRRYSINV